MNGESNRKVIENDLLLLGSVCYNYLLLEDFDQGLSQDLETGCLKLAIVKYLGIQIFKGDHNILRLQP